MSRDQQKAVFAKLKVGRAGYRAKRIDTMEKPVVDKSRAQLVRSREIDGKRRAKGRHRETKPKLKKDVKLERILEKVAPSRGWIDQWSKIELYRDRLDELGLTKDEIAYLEEHYLVGKPSGRRQPTPKLKGYPKIHKSGQYYRIRVTDPKKYEKFRTHDIGRPKHSKRIAGYDEQTKKWETQAYLIRKEDMGTPQADRLIAQIESRHGKIVNRITWDEIKGTPLRGKVNREKWRKYWGQWYPPKEVDEILKVME